ncbi:hypothetical protein HOY80DRAFT_886683, partial [Tuber brumale]
LVASPDGFDTTTQSPALPNYQSNPPTQPVGRAIDQYGDYFFDNPNYPRYSFDQEQLVCTPQIQEQDPCLNVGNFGQPPAYQRTYRDESQDTGPGNEILDPRVCRYCGKMFGRKTDRERHESTKAQADLSAQSLGVSIPSNSHASTTSEHTSGSSMRCSKMRWMSSS